MDRKDRTVRNQINFILAGLTFQKHVKFIKMYQSADVNSDHNPVLQTSDSGE